MEERKRFQLRVDADLMEMVGIAAEREGCSVNEFIIRCINEKLAFSHGYVGHEKALYRLMQLNARCMMMLMDMVGRDNPDLDLGGRFATAEQLSDEYMGYTAASLTKDS